MDIVISDWNPDKNSDSCVRVILSAVLAIVQATSTQDSELHDTASPGHGEEAEGHSELPEEAEGDTELPEEQTELHPEVAHELEQDSELPEEGKGGSELFLESNTRGILLEPSELVLLEHPELSQGYSAPDLVIEHSDQHSELSRTYSSPGTHVELSLSDLYGVSDHYEDSFHDSPSYSIHDISHSSHSLSHEYGDSSYGVECGDGQITHVDGSCVTPYVTRRLYVFEAPKLPRYPTPPPLLPPPRIVKNVLYVRTPEEDPSPAPIVLPPIEKNIVYILNKRHEAKQKVIEAPIPQEETPEVYYVDYTNHDNPEFPTGGDLHSALALTSRGSKEKSEGYGKGD
ncbi:hypothetical protein E2C01_059965 [Portunus trituberculatus]|uniref:DUF243 domain-containing protein n=1 Tax=Portunus trituberculatus TaxID=210409 RepID=A0A5B7H7M1_PORTR|nr:hypothetical protein [Portunus trituberculatus]